MTASIAELLRAAGIALVDARALLRAALGVDDAYLAAHSERVPGAEECERYSGLLERRCAGEPVAYLTGEREFYSLAFKVTPAVLIPRPETELLVEIALEKIPPDAPRRVLDLATGSGCVSIAIAKHRPRARVVATEIDRAALDVARENARRHAARNVEFVESDWFGALGAARFDVIVANPPYIAAGDPHLEEGDLWFEPRRALVAGPSGLECIGPVIARAHAHLVAGGWLLFEHGHDQAARCRALLERIGFQQVASWRDLAGIERVSGGQV
ncbi:MAG: peptide chain release factor N(5)-glutamine methyltransferase [Betaproteobacteria bacterium]|nr:peptide chain release factor N(5)-glutamine methyltransferase [Betaproteobacteria bacterium]